MTDKDIIKIQAQQIEELINQLEQKEDIIKEVREYIKDKYYDRFLEDGLEELLNDNGLNDRKQIIHILEILDKVD